MELPLLNVFVYGTLKRGQRNHEPYCSGALSVREARVSGWLYDLPFGFPGLMVPAETVLAIGTEDYAGDAGKQYLACGLSRSLDPVVHGELLTFDDPAQRLPALDGLEEFRPGEPGLYRRVLIPVQTNGEALLAWAYAIKNPSGKQLSGGRWPP